MHLYIMITFTDNISLWFNDLLTKEVDIIRSEYCFNFKTSLRAATDE